MRSLAPMLLVLAILLAGGCASRETLSLRPEVGEQMTYHVMAQASFQARNLAGLPAGAEGLFSAGYRMEYDTALVVEKWEGSVVTLTTDVSNMTGTITVAGREVPMGPLGPGAKLTVKLDSRTGEVLELSGLPDGTAEDLKGLVGQSIARLPEGGKARPGDSWTVELGTPIRIGDAVTTFKQTFTTTYTGTESRNDVKVAKLVGKGTGPFTVTGSQMGARTEAKGTLESEGVTYADLRTGMTRESDTTVRGTFRQTVEAQGTSISMDIDMTMHIVMTRK